MTKHHSKRTCKQTSMYTVYHCRYIQFSRCQESRPILFVRGLWHFGSAITFSRDFTSSPQPEAKASPLTSRRASAALVRSAHGASALHVAPMPCPSQEACYNVNCGRCSQHMAQKQPAIRLIGFMSTNIAAKPKAMEITDYVWFRTCNNQANILHQ